MTNSAMGMSAPRLRIVGAEHGLDMPDRLLDRLDEAIYVYNAAGRVVRFNRRATELWGRRPNLDDPEERFCGAYGLYRLDGILLPHAECPMADVLRSGEPVVDQQVVIERPDGSRVVALVNIEAIKDGSGRIVGAVNCFSDITDRGREVASLSQDDMSIPGLAKHALNEHAAQQLAAIVTSSHDAIVSKDTNGIILSWNGGAERLFGYSADEVIGKPVTILIPVDRLAEEQSILERLRRGERIDHFETIRRRRDGSLVEISLTVSPIRDASGRIIGASKVARDITEGKQAQQRQALLLREINHRVKNVFALAGSLAALAARSAKTPADMAGALRSRLMALSRAHDLTLPDLSRDSTADKATTLCVLVEAIASPYTLPESNGHRINARGPPVEVRRSAVTAFALLLHEFATNATKYGALSSPCGRVEVEWSVNGGELSLTWREFGGPPLSQPLGSEGFGSRLIDATVTGQLAGKIMRDWKPAGLCVTVNMPLDALA